MSRLINADDLIAELEAACMPIYEEGLSGITGSTDTIADIINEQAAVKEKEPAPTAIGTSSRVSSSNDTNSLVQFDDSTKSAICQEVENAHYRLVQAFDEDLDSNLGIRLYGEAMGLLEVIVHSLKGGEKSE